MTHLQGPSRHHNTGVRGGRVERGFNCGWGGNARLRSGVAPLFVSRAQHHLLALPARHSGSSSSSTRRRGAWRLLGAPFAPPLRDINHRDRDRLPGTHHHPPRSIHIGCGGEYGRALVSCQDILSSLFLLLVYLVIVLARLVLCTDPGVARGSQSLSQASILRSTS